MVYGARTPPRCVPGARHSERSTDDCSAARALSLKGRAVANRILQEWEREREVGRVLVGEEHGHNLSAANEGPLSGAEI